MCGMCVDGVVSPNVRPMWRVISDQAHYWGVFSQIPQPNVKTTTRHVKHLSLSSVWSGCYIVKFGFLVVSYLGFSPWAPKFLEMLVNQTHPLLYPTVRLSPPHPHINLELTSWGGKRRRPYTHSVSMLTTPTPLQVPTCYTVTLLQVGNSVTGHPPVVTLLPRPSPYQPPNPHPSSN